MKHWRLEHPEYHKTEQYKLVHNRANKIWKKKNWEIYMKKHLLHKRLRKKKPKQEYCTICNRYKKQLELANIDGQYSENIKDYMWLCRQCHILFDITNQTHRTEV